MSLDHIYSHPKTINPRTGKLITTHTSGVIEKATKKYKGPKKYKKYLELIGIFHDVGKLNPNFQDYIFNKKINGYKNHSYLSSIVLLVSIIKNKEEFTRQYELNFLASAIIQIAKHHGDLPNFSDQKLNPEELNKVIQFIQTEVDVANQFITNVNEFLKFYKFNFKDLNTNDFNENYINYANKFLSQILSHIELEKKLEYFLITQYIFSCLLEGDKRDASDNNIFQLDNEIDLFNAKYFNKSLKNYYKQFEKQSKKQPLEKIKLNKVRTEIKNTCVYNVKKYVKEGKRVFQIISPTGSGKTLTFLSVAGAIKQILSNKNLKLIYAIPFLSITDQVTQECEKIFSHNKNHIRRIDSAGKVREDLVRLNDTHDYDMNDDVLQAAKDFSENIFDSAFIVTTFVKLFESLLSNKNKLLLRYNNFSQSIIIIDEIQALPPRSYTFLIALLSKFAELFDSYIIIGSATVPLFEIPEDDIGISKLFNTYIPPINLLDDYEEKFEDPIFSRYSLEYRQNIDLIDKLVDEVIAVNNSCLCVVNTRNASLELYQKLAERTDNKIFLLNTNQILQDRRKKLAEIKQLLNKGERVILVSTQLIEAGIDISFPYIFRDIAPFPSIIQTAGRCNRNKEIDIGRALICCLKNNKGKPYFEYVYKDLMDFTQKDVLSKLNGKINENQLLKYQSIFFNRVKTNLKLGLFPNSEYTLPECVKELMFEEISKFKLIEDEFDTVSIFIIQNDNDYEDWMEFKRLEQELKNQPFDYNNKTKIKEFRRFLSDRVLNFSRYHIEHNFNLQNILSNNTVLGLSCLDLIHESYVGINYDYHIGLSITKNEAIII